jgi:hypothetical protein
MALIGAPTTVAQAWMRVGETVSKVATEMLPAEESEPILAGLRAVMTVDAPIGVLVSYFSDVPSHRTACVQLDQSLFGNPIPFPGTPVPLGPILERFSKLGARPFGAVWLAVLDLAEACNPTLDVAGARDYIRQRTSAAAAAPPGGPGDAGLPTQAQIDGILRSVVAAFPGIGDAVQEIVAPILAGAANPATSADGVTNLMESLQTTLLKPMLENLAGSGNDVMPAISQIMEGFKSLNHALNAAPADGPPTAGGDVTM